MRRARLMHLPISSLLLLCLLLSGCSVLDAGTSATPVPGAAATAARAAATPIPTRPGGAVPPLSTPNRAPSPAAVRKEGSPIPTGPPPEAVVERLARALERQDVCELEGLLLEQVALATGNAGGVTLPREGARMWLSDHIAPGIAVQSWQHVEHFGLVEVITEPWPTRPPVSTGKVTFNLHRFDQRGQQDMLAGEWKIDVIIAE
jgi:hypothetical protein